MVCRRNRCLEATGSPNLNAQSPLERQWRLRFGAKYACSFDTTMELKDTHKPHGQSPLPEPDPPELIAQLHL